MRNSRLCEPSAASCDRGLVITVEPILAADGWTMKTSDHSLAAPIVLTAA